MISTCLSHGLCGGKEKVADLYINGFAVSFKLQFVFLADASFTDVPETPVRLSN